MELVLVYLRACTVTQTCRSRVGVQCTTGGARRHQVLFDPQMSPPCKQEPLGWYDALSVHRPRS